ncbi:hypothetical protein STEG23_010919 [Scotinomys teguina]
MVMLTSVTTLDHGAIWLGLLLRTMSRCVVLPQLVSVMMSMSQVITKGYTDARFWVTNCGHGVKGHAMAGAVTTWVDCTATSDHVVHQPELLPRAMSESMTLLQPGSVLMSTVPVNIEGFVDVQGQGPHLEFSWGPRATLQLG